MRTGSLIWAAAFSVTANPPTRGAPPRSRRPSRSPRLPRRTASARTVTCAGSSCCWPA